ncbi:MAG: winged helix-turn-helix domain-containing protein [Bryobacterales bacterium]
MLFGSFEADLASGELRKGGVRVKLPEQSFTVLEALLEQPGAIVSREELQKRVWTPDTHVGFERSLNTIVHTLRSALGDSARNPRFIETVHGRGYRLLTTVRPGPLVCDVGAGAGRPCGAAPQAGRIVAVSRLGGDDSPGERLVLGARLKPPMEGRGRRRWSCPRPSPVMSA